MSLATVDSARAARRDSPQKTFFADFDNPPFETIGPQTMLLTGFTIGRKDGASERILLSIENITERKLAEEELKKLMQQEQAARAEAEAANRVRDEFLAMVSHELRTPLNAIVGWTHLLKRGALTQPDTERAIETIERNAKAQASIINELLDVSAS
jgi:two-component system CheB/CheR fusion protein